MSSRHEGAPGPNRVRALVEVAEAVRVMALATVLSSEDADRLGVCAAPSCDRVFVDASRNGTRRFCSEACQNRVKAAAHRARQRP